MNDLPEEQTKENIEKLADIIFQLNLGLRQCDCIALATKLIELDLIKE